MRVLFVTSPLLRGPDVFELQTKLLGLGYDVGEADGVYGPATASGVMAFQRVAGLVADGVAGPKTFAALSVVDAPPSQGRSESSVGLLALTEARKWLGTKETPPGSNITPFSDWFGIGPGRWCAMFVSYCLKVGANYELCGGSKGISVVKGKGCAYCPTIRSWLENEGLWLGRISDPLPGDIVLYDLNRDPNHGADHIGFVDNVKSGGKFEDISGNFSDKVMNETYKLNDSRVLGFGRIV